LRLLLACLPSISHRHSGRKNLRLQFGSEAPSPTLRVLLQNVSPQEQDVLTGYDNGRGPVYNLTFIAKTRDGKVVDGHELAAFFPVTGLVLPLSVSLRAGAIHELVFPLRNIIYSSRTDTLENLTLAGSSVRVFFEVNGPSSDTLPHQWSGKLNSLELTPAH
jgi:hypothetical protein